MSGASVLAASVLVGSSVAAGPCYVLTARELGCVHSFSWLLVMAVNDINIGITGDVVATLPQTFGLSTVSFPLSI